MSRRTASHEATRRGVLAAAVGGLAAIAGCNTLSNGDRDDDAVRVPALEVENQDDDAHDIELALSREDGSQAFASTASVAAGDATVFDAPVDGSAAYTLVVSLDDDRVERELAAYVEGDQRCVRPVVRVTADSALKLTAQTYDDC
ncbi:hypothetical protein [Halorubellus litoreus]|uniref:Ig-like domain-containing protein n=1 Tax=Halorubellus litoreus TaxID=755308 RepID=A0ABD5VMF9_9EURY